MYYIYAYINLAFLDGPLTSLGFSGGSLSPRLRHASLMHATWMATKVLPWSN